MHTWLLRALHGGTLFILFCLATKVGESQQRVGVLVDSQNSQESTQTSKTYAADSNLALFCNVTGKANLVEQDFECLFAMA